MVHINPPAWLISTYAGEVFKPYKGARCSSVVKLPRIRIYSTRAGECITRSTRTPPARDLNEWPAQNTSRSDAPLLDHPWTLWMKSLRPNNVMPCRLRP